MKIAVALGKYSIGKRSIDFDHIWDSERGLTGTDLCFIRLGEELEKLGNEVELFHNVSILNLDETFDAVISINEPMILKNVSSKIYKVMYMMLNDFSFCTPNFDDYVDTYIGVCKQHTDHIKKNYPQTANKWQTVGLGCDPHLYKDERVDGRVVWTSSADRGLHWLLQCWQDIKAAYPPAHLRVLYHFNYGQDIKSIEPSTPANKMNIHTREMAQRVRYMEHAIKVLKPLGVEHIGSVSRNQMVKEWNAASVFGYSCDTVAFSEGFSVSSLEAHASYTVPILTSQDCLGGIYKDSGCIMLEAPVSKCLPKFTQSIIKSLTDKKFADSVIEKTRAFSEKHTWKKCANDINDILQQRINRINHIWV